MLYCEFSPASCHSKSQRTKTQDLTAFSHTDPKDKKAVELSAERLNLLKNFKLLSDTGLVASLKYHSTILPKDERMKIYEWKDKSRRYEVVIISKEKICCCVRKSVNILLKWT